MIPLEKSTGMADNSLDDVVERTGAKKIIEIVGTEEIAEFTDFEESLDIRGPTIATRLDELEKAGILDRTYEDGLPPDVEYSLTPAGQDIYQDRIS